MTKLLDSKKINEVIDVIEDSGETDEQNQAAIGVGFLLGNYTDVELSIKKRKSDGKYIAEVKQQVDIAGLFSSVLELIRTKKR